MAMGDIYLPSIGNKKLLINWAFLIKIDNRFWFLTDCPTLNIYPSIEEITTLLVKMIRHVWHQLKCFSFVQNVIATTLWNPDNA